ncbi:MAG: hypothetical protein AAF560_01890 [Acidobacteriota bacterium]
MLSDPATPTFRPFSGTLDLVQTWVPEELVASTAWSRLQAAAARLPAALTQSFYLECHLAGDVSRTDLILEIGDAGRVILAGENPAIQLERSVSAHPTWEHLAQLCRQWIHRPNGVCRQVQRLWLELDLDVEAGRQAVPAPRLFVDWHQPLPAASARRTLEPFLNAFGALTGAPASEAREALRYCLDGLTPETSIYSLGLFPEHREPALRLCVRGPETRQVEYVRKLERFGELPCLPLASSEEGQRGRILHLDASRHGIDRIGFERGLRQLKSPDLLKDTYLDCLVDAGLCSPAKRLALAAWPGGRVETFPHEIWPSLAARWVNHVKVTQTADGAQRAKAYLCHRHVPRL